VSIHQFPTLLDAGNALIVKRSSKIEKEDDDEDEDDWGQPIPG
jgi:hypothetical protein